MEEVHCPVPHYQSHPTVCASWLDPLAHSHLSLHYPKECAAGPGHRRRQIPHTTHCRPRKAIWSVFSKACCGSMRGNCLKLNKNQLRLDMRKKIFTMRVVKHWNSHPKRWWMPCPWKHSRSACRGFWAPWSSGKCPAHGREIKLDGL